MTFYRKKEKKYYVVLFLKHPMCYRHGALLQILPYGTTQRGTIYESLRRIKAAVEIYKELIPEFFIICYYQKHRLIDTTVYISVALAKFCYNFILVSQLTII